MLILFDTILIFSGLYKPQPYKPSHQTFSAYNRATLCIFIVTLAFPKPISRTAVWLESNLITVNC